LAELQREHEVDVLWLPFELRPEPAPLPDMSGPDRERYYRGWKERQRPVAEELGLEMNFPEHKPRSRLAHEAVEHARTVGKADAMRKAIFEAFFVHNQNIGELNVLVELSAGAGLEPADLRQALENGAHSRRVVELETVSQRLGVAAVPTIVIGGLAVEGMQRYPVLRQVLEAAERRAAEAGDSDPGQALGT
jgi:predicted DsbA family dithiol-disulfide isomerase